MIPDLAREYLCLPPHGKCPYCGEEAELELFEVWSPRSFQLATCCEALHEIVCSELAEETRESAALLTAIGIDEIGLGTLRRTVDDGCGSLILDWKLTVVDVPQAVAKAFVRDHHAHCPPPAGWRFGAGIRNGPDLIGVVMVGRPVAREIDASKVCEVNRLCVRRDVPPGLVWSACSQLYGYAARKAKKLGFEQIITYVMQDELATTLRAAGWVLDGATRGGSWSCPSRPRVDRSPTGRKFRWKRVLRGDGLHLPKVRTDLSSRRASNNVAGRQLPSLTLPQPLVPVAPGLRRVDFSKGIACRDE